MMRISALPHAACLLAALFFGWAVFLPAQTGNNPVPGISSLSPSSVAAGGGAFTLTVNGTGFISSSVVRWQGNDRPTTFVSSGQLRAAISATDILQPGNAGIRVFNPAPGGGSSNEVTFVITSAANPVPTITTLSPLSVAAGGGAFTLTVNGTGFIPSSVVRWQGNDRPTTFVSSGQLRAAISASDILQPGNAGIKVFNPAPGGGNSNEVTFVITSAANPVPTIGSISPNNTTAGGPGFILTVDGLGFIPSSVVRWEGNDRSTNFVGSTQLQAAIPAGDINKTGTAKIKVFNPAPGGGSSNEVVFLIGATSNPAPVISSLSPNSAGAGGDGFTLTVNGSNFVPSSVVRWNGRERGTTFLTTSQLQAAIHDDDIETAGAAQVTVSNPPPGGGISNPLLFTITAAANLAVSAETLSFTIIQGAPGSLTQTVSIGGGNVKWTADARTKSGGQWLSVSPASGVAPSLLSVVVNPAGLTARVYSGTVRVEASDINIKKNVSVTLVVSRSVPFLQLSQSGFVFQGLEGGPNIPSQTFQVLNLGEGNMNWQVLLSTADGRNWLSATPSSGSTAALSGARSPSVTVQVNPALLKAGTYVGLVTVDAPGAPNSPLQNLVVLNTLASGSDPVGLVQPAGLIFSGVAAGVAPGVQELTLSSTGAQLLQFVASGQTQTGGNWLKVTPSTGSLAGSSEARLQVQALTAGLQPGVYLGRIAISLSTGKRQDVAVALVLTAVAASPAAFAGSPASACTPSQLALVETLLAGNFLLSLGWPAALLVQVADNCGQPFTTASVIVTFTNGDPALVLANLKDGRYVGTWVPVNDARAVGVTLRASAPEFPVARLTLDGTLLPVGGPLIFRNGAVNAASYAPYAPLAPGSIFSIFGRNLGTGIFRAGGLPLPRELGAVKVTLGNAPVPLFYADPGQVNGQVPVELAAGSTASLLVSVRGVATPPDTVTLADVEPGIFTVDGSGAGQGAVVNAAHELVNADRPAAAGQIVQVFCTGLGQTTPAVPSGEASPGSPPAEAINPVTATIGGLSAPVHFAGLTPGFAGLYQVNVQVPAGLPAGNAVPLILTQGGVSSNTVTLAVR